MRIFTLLAVLLLSVALYAQENIDFDNNGQDFEWVVFDQDDLENSFQIVDNTDFLGINTTVKVGKHISEAGKVPWSGIKTSSMGAITLTDENSCISVLVRKAEQIEFGLKLEDGDKAGTEIKKMISATNEWEMLFFDFKAVTGGIYNTLVIFPDFAAENPRAEGHTTYFDEITFNNTSVCNSGTSIEVSNKTRLLVYPNPAADILFVQGDNMQSIDIVNVMGQQIKSLANINNDQVNIPVNDLSKGIYFVVAHLNKGEKSIMKFTKK
ncbi:MAG: T9SS type A sorting domain-containing protein [Salinivirgaceae bacterium]|jgi:hypothetical protein|nr:T9SS type A sorting domain-containing protein [Salinivirgaceae bacterium]